MRRTVLGALVALVLVVSATGVAPAAAHGHHDIDREPVFTVPTPDAPPTEAGFAVLRRTDDQVRVRFRGTGLERGIYTLWWIVFNEPANCLVPFECGPADLADPEVVTDIGYAGGTVVRRDGIARVKARLSEGADLTGFPPQLPVIQSETGLIDARTAEVHVVLHSHERTVPGLRREMLRTFAAGCDHDFGPEFGTPGPNTNCRDVQFSVFRA